jgi:hypothetical protein
MSSTATKRSTGDHSGVPSNLETLMKRIMPATSDKEDLWSFSRIAVTKSLIRLTRLGYCDMCLGGVVQYAFHEA